MSRYRKTMSEATRVQKISEALPRTKNESRQIQNIKRIWQFKTKRCDLL